MEGDILSIDSLEGFTVPTQDEQRLKKKMSHKKKKRTTTLRVWIHVVLLSIVALLIILIYRLFTFHPVITENTQQVQSSSPNDYLKFEGVTGFAETFARAWLSGNVDDAKKYFAVNADLEMIPNEMENTYFQRLDTWGVNYISTDEVTVTVRVLLRNSIFYLSIPVIVQEGRYGIKDIPTIVAPPANATLNDIGEVDESDIPSQDQAEIQKKVNFYFEQYTNGSSDSLALVFSDQEPRPTLSNAQYLDLKDISLHKNDDGSIEADATADIEINGTTLLQKTRFVFIKKGSTWLIQTAGSA